MRQGLLSSVTSWLQSALGRAGVFPNSEFGLHPTASIEQELDERIAWFIAMRWIAVCGVLGTILVGNLIFHLEAPIFPLLGVIVFMVSHNTACHVVIRVNALPRHSLRACCFANAQIAIDLVSLTLLLHYSGGAENPFAFYFIFHMIIASILLSRLATYLQAALAILLYNGMALAENAGLIPHVHLSNFLPVELLHTLYVPAVQLVFTTTVGISVYMATSITQRLRTPERKTLSLSVQLAEQNEKLQDAYDMLSHTQTLQTQYMRKVSHELRSPLAAIESMLNLVVSNMVTDEGKRRNVTERSLNRVRSLLQTLSDLLTLLRSRDVKPRERLEPVDLGNVGQRVLELLSPQADQEGIDLAFEIQPGLAPVLGDAEELEAMFTNLIANGIKYTPGGGRVALRIASESGKAVIEVRDTGIGIDEEEIPLIFGEFFRAKRGREFAAVGTGLGLCIVKSIIDSHNGTVEVDSRMGEGTTFRVCLPQIVPEQWKSP